MHRFNGPVKSKPINAQLTLYNPEQRAISWPVAVEPVKNIKSQMLALDERNIIMPIKGMYEGTNDSVHFSATPDKTVSAAMSADAIFEVRGDFRRTNNGSILIVDYREPKTGKVKCSQLYDYKENDLVGPEMTFLNPSTRLVKRLLKKETYYYRKSDIAKILTDIAKRNGTTLGIKKITVPTVDGTNYESHYHFVYLDETGYPVSSVIRLHDDVIEYAVPTGYETIEQGNLANLLGNNIRTMSIDELEELFIELSFGINSDLTADYEPYGKIIENDDLMRL